MVPSSLAVERSLPHISLGNRPCQRVRLSPDRLLLWSVHASWRHKRRIKTAAHGGLLWRLHHVFNLLSRKSCLASTAAILSHGVLCEWQCVPRSARSLWWNASSEVDLNNQWFVLSNPFIALNLHEQPGKEPLNEKNEALLYGRCGHCCRHFDSL